MTTKPKPADAPTAAAVVSVDPSKSAAEQLLELQLRKELDKVASQEALSIVSNEAKSVETPMGTLEWTETVFANGSVRKSF
jgi:hypothetical protein